MLVKSKKKRIRKPRIKPDLPEESMDLDPRRQTFAAAFYDPTSDTYGQLVPSGLKAGFTTTYSQNLTNSRPKWLLRIIEKMDLMTTVKKNIKKHLELKTEVPVMTAFGPYKDKKTKKFIMHEDAKLLKIQQDMTIFVAEKLIPDYKKNADPVPFMVDFKQVIIINPNADSKPTIGDQTNPQAISSISTS